MSKLAGCITLFYNGGKSKYRVEKSLAPGEHIWLNLGELLHNQLPDSDGATIPPDVMFGSYELRDLGHPVIGQLYEGKLVVDKTYGHASYGCNHCCGYSQSQLSPTPFGGPPGIDNTDTYQSYSVCNARWEDFDEAFNPSSTNTGVATLNAGLNLHTVAAGGATASAKNTLPFQANRTSNCVNTPMPGPQPVKVQVPTRLQVLPDTRTISLSYVHYCSDGMYGIAGAIHYQVLDQNGGVIASTSMEPQEKELNLVYDGVPQGDPLPDWGDMVQVHILGQHALPTLRGRSGTPQLGAARLPPTHSQKRSPSQFS
ncbi:MAG: hypothetical protein ACRD3L_13175 [Terriglobales bacterium]